MPDGVFYIRLQQHRWNKSFFLIDIFVNGKNIIEFIAKTVFFQFKVKVQVFKLFL